VGYVLTVYIIVFGGFNGLTLCEICEKRESVSTCRICGRYVCSHHIGDDGICSVCRETLCERCRRYLSI